MRAVLTVLAALAGVWLVLVLAAWGLQRQLIYLPTGADPVPPGHVEEVTLPTADGLELTAWHVTPEEEPVATVLVLPGNAGDRSLRLPLAEGLVARGHAVLLVDYRGYGGNPGSPDEAGLRMDALAARDHLLGREDVDADRLVYLGESLGSGVAAALAGEHPPAALVLRSPFGELADVGRAHYPILPVRTLLWDRFETREHLADHDGPVLVVAGGQDAIVPTELSAEVARAVDAEYRELEGVDHNDRELLDGEGYLDAVDEFVRAQLGQE
jgi:uncharacterized protein